MKGHHRALVFLVLFSASIACQAIKITSDGGYTDIVIRIKDEVPEDNCPQILENLKKLLTESSHTLYEALDHKVYFKSATIVIPKSWRDSMCQTVIHQPKGNTPYRSPQFFVQNNHPIYGKRPFTQQSRGCGQPGDYTGLPFDFLTTWNNTWETFGDPSKLFVKEWAKLRYGIFDELGFAGDLLYPNYYNWNGRVMPTLATDAPLNGEWLNSDKRSCHPQNDETCQFVMAGSNDQVTCSLGSYHFLPSVKGFCSSDKLMSIPPTKHNVLCKGQSSLEVILGHDDFFETQGRRVNDLSKVINPEITVVRQPETKYVLIMETSSSMDHGNQWKWINKAAQKFIRYDLPLHSNLAIVTFSNSSKVAHGMSAIHSDEARARLADTVPDKYHLTSSEVKCLLCGVRQAIQEVLRGQMAGAHLILLTRGSPDTLSISDEQTIQDYVKYYHITVSSILLPDTEKLPLAFYDSIAQASGGFSHVVSSHEQNSMKLYVDLMHAFSGLLTEIIPPVHVHEQLIPMDGHTSSSGKFIIDTTLGRDTSFGIYVEDEEDHLIKSVSFTDSKGFLYGPYTSMSSLYDIINLKTINFPIGEEPPFDDPEKLGSEWQYVIEWYPGGGSEQRSLVKMTSQPRYGEDDIVVHIWSNSYSPSDIVTSQHPLAIYAQVIKGPSPVLNADVSVDVTVTMPDGLRSTFRMKLVDNGLGGADLVAGDGIYSRYLTRYDGAGRYSFDVTVTDNNKGAFTIRSFKPKENFLKIGQVEPQECCGSRVEIKAEDRIPTGAFLRQTKGPVIHLLSVPPSDVDLMPPANIKNLKIQILPKSGQLVATWTAPGDDFDVGTVTGYRFVVAENYSNLLDPMGEKQTLVGFQQPDKAGASTSYQFGLARIDDFHDRDIYLGILAFDEKNNEGSMSNIVMLHISSNGEFTTSDANKGGQGSPAPYNRPVKSVLESAPTVIIGSICGALLIIGIIMWLSIWYIRNQRGSFKSTKASTIEVGLVNETQSDSSPPSTIQRESETLKRHLMTVIEPSANQQASNHQTPIYWSASQLLDNNNLMSRGVNATLDPISEEITTSSTEDVNNEDEEVYARGLANYGLQTQQQLRQLHQAIHEPIYVAYSPDNSTIYGTSSRGGGAKKVPPKVPPKPSINALLGIGIVIPNQPIPTPPANLPPLPTNSSQNNDIYGTAKATRHISHV